MFVSSIAWVRAFYSGVDFLLEHVYYNSVISDLRQILSPFFLLYRPNDNVNHIFNPFNIRYVSAEDMIKHHVIDLLCVHMYYVRHDRKTLPISTSVSAQYISAGVDGLVV